MPDLSGTTIDRYHLIEKLGEGGMAVVYKAYDTRLEREVALKIIRTDLFGSAVIERILLRFEREAKLMARLSHPNIVRIHDYGELDGSPYLVMEYVPGGTLKQLLGKPMSVQEAVHLLIPVAQALNYAHREKVLHRDIKPSNILLNRNGDPLLTDFGIAKLLDIEEAQTLTGTGVGVGTPEYMAPEQGLGSQVDARTDVYALGVVFYEMMTGRRPYEADTPLAVLVKQTHDPLPRPKELIPGLPEEVEHVLFKALAKKPEDRYASMADFASALSRLTIGGEAAILQPVRQTPTPHETHRTDSLETVDQFTSESPGRVSVKPVPTPAMVRQKDAVHHKTAEPMKVLVPAIAGVVVVTVLILGGLNGWFGGGAVATIAPGAVQFTGTAYMPTESLGIGSRMTGKDGMVMVYVPGGTFQMGSLDGTGDFDEYPQHEVTLDSFWIDQSEITNAMYAQCVAAGNCSSPNTNWPEYGNSQYDDHPVVSINWNQAKEYCEWAGRQLPTEAQWEYAARGIDGRIYPWGFEPPTCDLANFEPIADCIASTTVVKSYPAGISWVGAYDLAGNVWEWVADWYDENYYRSNTNWYNPVGPTQTTNKVLRGGAWYCNVDGIRSANREYASPSDPSDMNYTFGFRCALNARVSP